LKSKSIRERIWVFNHHNLIMLAFAKDIRKTDHTHPEESNDPKLEEYMDYQRKLNHEMLVYHSLDHGKIYLQRVLDSGKEEEIKAYLTSDFPISSVYADSDKILLMLRKLINGHNSTNNWYRMNSFYQAIVYDCVNRFCKIYNQLLKDSPEKAEGYNVSKNVEVDFDDWIQLYFFNLDFMVGRPPQHTHYLFSKRNRAIENALAGEVESGSSKQDALDAVKDSFSIEEDSIKTILSQPITDKDLELFYTSVENPIYEYLYDVDQAGMDEEETLIDHSYFMGCQFRGLDYQEAEKTMESILNSQKNIN
jgi:hypothetical protein